VNRDVAVKACDARFSERFSHEAKTIAAMNHPDICRNYDVGPDYIVMEYIEGTPPKEPLARQLDTNDSLDRLSVRCLAGRSGPPQRTHEESPAKEADAW
jgi:serine/threonine protein kinase